ncbi:MAG: flagellar hook-length control protein FliK [Halioglobus sp.]|nr:flagellar hook-length control protein FliK [Halioglobus sp.]
MDELRLGLNPAARSSSDLGAFLRSWQLGQVLRALVVDNSSSGSVLLRIGSHQVSAATDIFLERGARLSLEVTGLQPSPTVRILESSSGDARLLPPLERQAQLLLPRQGSVFTPLLSLLAPAQGVNLLALLGVRGGVVDPAWDELVLEGPPRSPEALRKALTQSGLFFESELARQGPQGALPVDLKALLFRLLAKVTRARGEQQGAGGRAAAALLASLQQEVEGALATISLHQLAASTQRDQDAWIWVFHVPFRMRDELHGLSVSLRREPAAGDEQEQERQWKALLALDLPRLGSVEAEVFLRGSRVSAVFFSSHERTVRRLEGALALLEEALRGHAFDIGVLRVQRGPRETAADEQPWRAGLYQSA